MGILEATSTATQGVAQLLERASEVIPTITPSSAPLEIDPGEKTRSIDKLEDFCIPQVLRDLLTPALAELGFQINEVTLRGLPGTPPGKHNVIENRAGKRSLLHFPKEVLADTLVWQNVGNVFVRLSIREQTLLVLSEGLDATNGFYVAVGQKLWESAYKVTATFLPWTFLLPATPMPASDLLSVLPALLQLETLIAEAQKMPPPPPPALAIGPVTEAVLGTLSKIVSQLPVFIDNADTGWRTQFGLAGLQPIVGNFDFNGVPIGVSYNVLNQLRNYAALPDSSDPVLGRFLCQILTIPDLKVDDREQIKTVIRTYNLAPSGKIQ